MGCPSPQEPEGEEKARRSTRGQREGAEAFLTRHSLCALGAKGVIAGTEQSGTGVGN